MRRSRSYSARSALSSHHDASTRGNTRSRSRPAAACRVPPKAHRHRQHRLPDHQLAAAAGYRLAGLVKGLDVGRQASARYLANIDRHHRGLTPRTPSRCRSRLTRTRARTTCRRSLGEPSGQDFALCDDSRKCRRLTLLVVGWPRSIRGPHQELQRGAHYRDVVLVAHRLLRWREGGVPRRTPPDPDEVLSPREAHHRAAARRNSWAAESGASGCWQTRLRSRSCLRRCWTG